LPAAYGRRKRRGIGVGLAGVDDAAVLDLQAAGEVARTCVERVALEDGAAAIDIDVDVMAADLVVEDHGAPLDEDAGGRRIAAVDGDGLGDTDLGGDGGDVDEDADAVGTWNGDGDTVDMRRGGEAAVQDADLTANGAGAVERGAPGPSG